MKALKIVAFGIVAIWFGAMLVANIVKIVEPGHAGVVVTLGKVQEKSRESGPIAVWPFISDVVQFNVREQVYAFEIAMKAETVQDVTVTGALNYNLNGDQVYRLYKAVGEEYQPIVLYPLLEGALNQVVGKRSVEFIVSSSEMIREAVLYIMQDQINRTGLVNVNDLQMFKPHFDANFEKAVSDKVVAMQVAEKAKIETERVKAEALQMRERLAAEAYGLELNSKALQNPLIVEYEFAKAMGKWEGKLPSTLVVGDKASVPVLLNK
ncbi:MAG: prohibitin family protein [Alphaproteobacteria bacterium]|nr:prohibitin family protein [Alphaproteobacteria bacterium]